MWRIMVGLAAWTAGTVIAVSVDFSSGPRVSSLIASWYQHAPTITVTN